MSVMHEQPRPQPQPRLQPQPQPQQSETDTPANVRPANVRPVKSALRTIDVLEFLATRQPNPVRLPEISSALGAPRSSMYALLHTLASRGWVEIHDESYSLGIRVMIPSASYIDSDPYVRVVRPVLAELSDTYGETFHMGRIDGDDVVYLITHESEGELRIFSRVGQRMAASATGLGKAVLALRPDLIPLHLQQRTPYSITDPAVFKKEMDTTIKRGYATEDQENTIGLRCIAFALPYSSPVTDSISCSIPLAHWTEVHASSVAAGMRRAVARIVETAPRAHLEN